MKYKILLDEKQLEDLSLREKRENNPKILKRLQSIHLKNLKYKNVEIAKIIKISKRTVITWIKLYLEGGLEKLCNLNYNGSRKSILEPYKERIIKLIEENNISTLKELRDLIKREFGILIDTSWLGRYLKKNRLLL